MWFPPRWVYDVRLKWALVLVSSLLLLMALPAIALGYLFWNDSSYPDSWKIAILLTALWLSGVGVVLALLWSINRQSRQRDC